MLRLKSLQRIYSALQMKLISRNQIGEYRVLFSKKHGGGPPGGGGRGGGTPYHPLEGGAVRELGRTIRRSSEISGSRRRVPPPGGRGRLCLPSRTKLENTRRSSRTEEGNPQRGSYKVTSQRRESRMNRVSVRLNLQTTCPPWIFFYIH